MESPLESGTDEVKHLQRRINDLVSILALPAMWAGGEPTQIVRTLLETLLHLLRLDLVYVRLNSETGDVPLEMYRAAQPMPPSPGIGAAFEQWSGKDGRGWPRAVRKPFGQIDLSLAPLALGLGAEIGLLVAGSQRPDFPDQTETLILSVAANTALLGLQEARLLAEQKRVARELDQRVAQRTDELRRSEEFLAAGQRLSLTGSFSWRIEADEIEWSEQLYRIFEFEPGIQVTLGLIDSRIHPDDHRLWSGALDRARLGSDDFEYDQRLLMPDRSVKYLHVVAHRRRERDGRLEYTGAVQDVTQRRLSGEALTQARAELAHVTRVMSLGVLTASIAHEVNQPLAGIVTNASTCLRMLAADPPNLDGARETARRTIRDGNRAAEVIARLRALFSRKNAAMEPVDLNDAVREVITLSMSEIQRNRVTIHAELSAAIPPVTGDRVQLQQVVLNLLRNASDALTGVDDRPRQVVIRTVTEGDSVCLSVQDNGGGFDPQTAESLFEPFYTTKDDGMGMGLSLSRSIVERHQGRIWALQNDGPGATFAFSVPAAEADTKVH